MSREMQRASPAVVRPVLGGLNRKDSPQLIPPDQSPDLLNITLADRTVRRRGGFVPLIRQQARMNSLRNRGFRSQTIKNESATENENVLIVPGVGVAGHRPVFDAVKDNYAFDLFFSPENLIQEHVGNGEDNGAPPAGEWGPAPYDVQIRPILSKGPLKKTRDTTTATATAGTWNTTAATKWGPSSTDGMPFCLHLRQAGLAPATQDWRLALSFHVKQPATWAIRTIELPTTGANSLLISEGAEYHVICSFSVADLEVRLRAARIVKGRVPVYRTVTWTLTAGDLLPSSPCPLQLFDCPQAFIEDQAASATERPGLAFLLQSTGGYFFGTKRFEGKVEDIAFWSDKRLTSAADTILDRTVKLRPSDFGRELMALWTMSEPGLQRVKEVAGQGNHFYLAPAGPIYAEGTGATPSGSWAFNGLTSAVRADLAGEPNWYKTPRNMVIIAAVPSGGDTIITLEDKHGLLYNAEVTVSGNPGTGGAIINGTHTADPSLGVDKLRLIGANTSSPVGGGQVTFESDGFFQALRNQNRPWGVEVTFWPDAISPLFEQVVMEIHGVLRVAIDIDGTIAVYVRNGGAATYVAKQSTTYTVTPGERCSFAVVIDGVATSITGYVNGEQDFTSIVAGIGTGGLEQNPPGPITWGLGQADWLWNIITTPAPTPADASYDHRSGFIGRIESARVIAGDATVYEQYKDEELADWIYDQVRHFDNGNATTPRDELDPSDTYDTVLNVPEGTAVRFGSDTANGGRPLRYPIKFVNPSDYVLLLPMTLSRTWGHEQLRYMEAALYHTFARWVFSHDDDEEFYAGRYYNDQETRDVSGFVTVREEKTVHLERSAVTDQVGALGGVTKVCLESDLMTEDLTNMALAQWTHRVRPYGFRSPKELAPSFAEGIVDPQGGKSPITLIHDWKHEQSGERLGIAAVGRQLYWLRNIWRRNTPFAGEASVRSIWFVAQRGEHCTAQNITSANLIKVDVAYNSLELSCWLYAERLDGVHLVAMKAGGLNGSNRQQVNFAIWFEDGVFNIAGSLNGQTDSWRYRATVNSRPYVVLPTRQWVHLHVNMGTVGGGNDVSVHVNGAHVPLAIPAGWSAIDAGFADSDTDSSEFFLGGLPASLEEVTFVVADSTEVVTMAGWAGLMSELRVRNVVDTTNFPVNGHGVPPRARHQPDANTLYLFHLNEGQQWHIANSSTAHPDDHGHANMAEMVPIREGLDESSGAPYRAVSFRDRLYVTNGRSHPQEIRFLGFSRSESAFTVNRLGMQAPAVYGSSIATANIRLGTTALPSNYKDGLYEIRMTFVDALGRESDAVQLATIQLSNGALNPVALRVLNVPRSPDDQVTGRRFYVSPTGGGTPLYKDSLQDNVSQQVELTGPGFSPAVAATPAGTRLPAPRAVHIAVSSFQLVLVGLPGVAASGSSFTWSLSEDPSYFPLTQIAAIDSGDGSPIIAVKNHYGRLLMSKRASIHATDLRTLLGSGAVEINGSQGWGGGATAWNNVIFGGGDRGVNMFDGSNVRYASRLLDKLWRTLELGDDALLQQWGAFYWRDSFCALSVRRQGQESNDTLLLMHTSLPATDNDQLPWTECRVPEHSYMTSLRFGDRDEIEELVIGTVDAQVLRYAAAIDIDGHDNGQQDTGYTVLQGTATTYTSRSITITPSGPDTEFDVIGAGLRGARVKVTFGGNVFYRTISRNTRGTIYWIDAIETIAGTVTFEIGAFDAYYTTPWLRPQQFGSGVRIEHIDLECDPVSGGTLDVFALAALGTPARTPVVGSGLAQAFDESAATALSMDMTLGFLRDPIRVRSDRHGAYWRMKVGTDGLLKPFALTGYGIRYAEEGQRGNRTTR